MRAAPGTLYFYHPDHLETSTFLTDPNGELYQFFINLPYPTGHFALEEFGVEIALEIVSYYQSVLKE